jgi:GAF domain-containing protein
MADGTAANLATACLALARALHSRMSPAQALTTVAEHAAAGVPGADSAAVAVLRRGTGWRSLAHTDLPARMLDGAQVRSGVGPAVQSAPLPPVGAGRETGAQVVPPLVHVADTSARCGRWPGFADAAAGLGIRSVLVCRLWGERERLGSLSLYSRLPGNFDDASEQAAAVFGGYASMALAQAAVVDSLKAGLASRQVIGEATGILMERYKSSSAEAFAMLVAASQRLNTKLRAIALRVVETGRSPQEFTPAPTSSRPG